MENERRLFLKNGVLALAGTVALAGAGKAGAEPLAQKYGMIIDLNRCTGCQSCVVACKAQNDTVRDKFNTRLITMEDGNYPHARIVFTPVLCNQCENPPCVPASELIMCLPEDLALL